MSLWFILMADERHLGNRRETGLFRQRHAKENKHLRMTWAENVTSNDGQFGEIGESVEIVMTPGACRSFEFNGLWLASVLLLMRLKSGNKETNMNLPRMIPAAAGIALLFSNMLFGQNTPAISAFAAKGSTIAANDSIRPFHIQVPKEALAELHRRLAATRWPDQETDPSQGVPLATMKELVRYWDTTYDWRKAEAKLNALPEFVPTIDGVDIQFVHIRSRNPNAMPLIMTHGWPGSIFELVKVIEPLTDPTAYGGRAEDSFDLVLPSMPGYGFSGKPEGIGWGPDHIARAWAELMRWLGYQHYVAQGGDWGSVIADDMARKAPAGLLGIHVNMPATVPQGIAKLLAAGEPAPAGLSAEEKTAFDGMDALYRKGSGYALMMVTRPQTLGYSLTDSPVGLAAWFYDKFADWTYTGRKPDQELSRDDMLDDITLYWLTGTQTSSARLYWENNANNFNAVDIALPTAITVFPGEIYNAPRSWAEQSYHKLIYFHKVDKGGHFAAWEQPELFADDIRAAFRPLR
jgi:pimeloyl-ACP methyl ester carboxylesterase